MADIVPSEMEAGEDDRCIFSSNPLSLQDLASYKLAFSLRVMEFSSEVLSSVPSVIRDMVESKFQSIPPEFEILCKRSNETSYYINGEPMYTRYHLIAFGGNGTFHYKDTVANFLNDRTLSNWTRFEMACVHCVEEKVDFFWTLICDSPYIECIQFDSKSDFLTYYWICKKRGELDKIQFDGYRRIELMMIEKCTQVGYWLAIEYFLNSLDPDVRLEEINRLVDGNARLPANVRQQRVNRRVGEARLQRVINRRVGEDQLLHQVIELADLAPMRLQLIQRMNQGLNVQIARPIDSPMLFKITMHLLPYFDARLQHAFVNRRPTKVISAFVRDYNAIEYGLQAWAHIRDTITVFEFLDELIQPFILFGNYEFSTKPAGSRDDEPEFQPLDETLYPYTEMVLAELWSTAPSQLKQEILTIYPFYILNLMSRYRGDRSPKKNSIRDLRFVLALLSEAHMPVRNRFWNANWHRWITGVTLSQFDELTELCFENTNEIEEFKEQIKHSYVIRQHHDILLSRLNPQEVDELVVDLCYCCGQDNFSIMKRVLLETGYCKEAFLGAKGLEVSNIYQTLVSRLFSNNELNNQYKQRLVLSEHSVKLLYDKLSDNDFMYVETIVDLYLSLVEKLALKGDFLEFFRARIIKGEVQGFKESEWARFLKWCLNDRVEEIENFMKALPICDIFQVAFSSCLKSESNVECQSCTSEDLKKFLWWCFESASEYENFIGERIEYYRRMDEEDVMKIFGLRKGLVLDSMSKALL